MVELFALYFVPRRCDIEAITVVIARKEYSGLRIGCWIGDCCLRVSEGNHRTIYVAGMSF